MLYPYNENLLTCIAKERTAQYLREAEGDRWASELSPQRPMWLSQQARKALHNLGHSLIDLGQRLDRIETHPV